MNDAVRKARKTLEGTPHLLRDLLLERLLETEKTRMDPRLNEQYRRERIDAQEAGYRERVEAMRQDAEAAAEAMRAAAREADVRVPGSAMEQVLDELREQRAWQRYSYMMIMGTAPTEAVRRVSEAGAGVG